MFTRIPPRLPSTWTFKTKKHYKRSIINGDLHLSKRISRNFNKEILLITEKFMKADYPIHFIDSLNNEFQKGKDHGDENFIISPHLFGISKPFISIEIPCCVLNEIKKTF